MPMNAEGDGIVIVPMTLADLDGVMAVEESSFQSPWAREAFEQELTGNAFANYLVAKDGPRVIGYAGMWLILDEAHVTNVAIAPAYRGRHLGERLMLALIERARAQKATRMTLEVRVGNYIAQNLYAKLDFRGSGLRKGYYSDTGEDALIMWKEFSGEPAHPW